MIENYSLIFKASYGVFLIPTLLVILTAMLSASEMRGTLGTGLKKVAVGTIIDTVIITTFILLERGNRGLLNDLEVQLFFLISGLIGASFLIAGYVQIYKITKKLKLFTV